MQIPFPDLSVEANLSNMDTIIADKLPGYKDVVFYCNCIYTDLIKFLYLIVWQFIIILFL